MDRARQGAILLVLTSLLSPDAATANPWARQKGPSAGPAESIGASASGCLAGAVALPLEGAGYQAVHTSRRRYYGHPALVATVADLARSAREAGLGDLFIGDLSQPRGGPMPGGHASHQSGLDVDVFFDLSPKARRRPSERERIPAVSVVLPDNLSVDPRRFTAAHQGLLERAASSPGVERIFVHPAVKQALCRSVAGNRAWLAKLRPWYGHDAHFHVRIACPGGSPSCEAGPEIPPGDGCDETLAWWFMPEDGVLPARREVDPPPPTRPSGVAPKPLPEACRALLDAR